MAHVDQFANSSTQDACTSGFLKIGPLTRVEKIALDGPVALGANCIARRSLFGRYTATGDFCRMVDVEIGAFCSLGDNVLLNAGTHPKDWVSTSLFACNPNFWDWADEYRQARHADQPSFRWRGLNRIGNDVWIGANVVVLTGITIGDGAIIGANSVVTSDVEPYAIVAGAPARVLRKRFDDETIRALADSAWWTLSIEELLSLPITNVPAALRALRIKALASPACATSSEWTDRGNRR
jgi:acetyltransferase-like isoleucine patch superfamily enzyme